MYALRSDVHLKQPSLFGVPSWLYHSMCLLVLSFSIRGIEAIHAKRNTPPTALRTSATVKSSRAITINNCHCDRFASTMNAVITAFVSLSERVERVQEVRAWLLRVAGVCVCQPMPKSGTYLATLTSGLIALLQGQPCYNCISR